MKYIKYGTEFLDQLKDRVHDLYDENKELKQKVERLNNIINGMEKFFQYAYDNEVKAINDRKVSVWTICLEKLQELKGVNLVENDQIKLDVLKALNEDLEDDVPIG